jgi:hypothetical protein
MYSMLTLAVSLNGREREIRNDCGYALRMRSVTPGGGDQPVWSGGANPMVETCRKPTTGEPSVQGSAPHGHTLGFGGLSGGVDAAAMTYATPSA